MRSTLMSGMRPAEERRVSSGSPSESGEDEDSAGRRLACPRTERRSPAGSRGRSSTLDLSRMSRKLHNKFSAIQFLRATQAVDMWLRLAQGSLQRDPTRDRVRRVVQGGSWIHPIMEYQIPSWTGNSAAPERRVETKPPGQPGEPLRPGVERRDPAKVGSDLSGSVQELDPPQADEAWGGQVIECHAVASIRLDELAYSL